MISSGIFRKTVRDLRWQIFWYSLGLSLMGAFVVFIYPSYRDQLQDFELPEALQALIGTEDFTSPTGFLSAEFYSWTPIMLVVFAIMAGTSALAGEEDSGTVDLLLAQPLSRRRLALSKLAGLTAASILIAAGTYIGWLISIPFVDMDVSLARLALANAQLVPMLLVIAFLSVWCAAVLPDRKLATGLVTAIAVLSYVINYLSALVDVLSPLAWASVFNYSEGGETLTGSFDEWKSLVLLGVALLFAVLAIAAFERRDLGVRGAGFALPRWLALRKASQAMEVIGAGR